MLNNLASKVLSDDPTMRLTLMGFGVGPRRAGSFYRAADLAAFLETASQDDLLQERSATNCEVGFEFVDNYIDNSPNLKKAVVLYTSDGAANLDETPLDWSDWANTDVFDYFQSFTRQDLIDYLVGTELEHIYAGNAPLSATVELFPAQCAQIAIALQTYGQGSEEHLAALETLSTAIYASPEDYVSCVLKHVHMAGNLAWGESHSASDVEKAFQTYFRSYPGVEDESYGNYMDLFYVILGETGSTLADRYANAAKASANLMTNEKLVSLYHVGYSGASNTWMNPEKGYFTETDKLRYVYNTSFSGVSEQVDQLTSEFITTAYKDVTVTDPMSKWVTLEPSTIRIYDDTTETVLWQYGQGWLTDVQLTEGEPITVTTNADGHQEITWRVKDGYLLHTDRYSMRYVINVDETAEGFEWGKDYPANDPTNVTYKDPEDQEHTYPIEVPEVKEDTPREDLTDGDYGIRIYKQTAADRKPISDIVFDIYKVTLQEGDIRNLEPTAEEIARYAVAENLVTTLTTDGYGYAFAKLEEGIYMIVERESEKVKAPVAPFYVLLPMYDQATDTYQNIVDIYPKNEPVEETPDVPEPEIPEEPTVTTGTFTIVKHDAQDETRLLAGAQFQVLRLPAEGETGTAYPYGEAGQTIDLVPVVDAEGNPILLTTDDGGKATSPQLALGLYFLKEIQAPAGYYIQDSVIPVYATVTGADTTTEPVRIPNNSGALLPSTGGMGTTMLYALGALLLLGSAVVLVTKRRVSMD